MLKPEAIERFRKDHPSDVLGVSSLETRQISELLAKMATSLGVNSAASLPEIFLEIEKRGATGSWESFNLWRTDTSLEQAFEVAGIGPNPEERVFVAWLRERSVDSMTARDLHKIFDYSWYAGFDDIVIADEGLKWLLTINHSGGIAALKFDSASIESRK